MFIVRPQQSVTLAIGVVTLFLSACGGGGASTNAEKPVLEKPVYRAPFNLASVGQDMSLLPAVSHDAAGQTQTPNLQIDQAVQRSLSQFKIPGAAIAVLQDGKIVYTKAYGYANLVTKSELQPEQRFTIGSLTKQFAASAIMLFLEAAVGRT